MRVDVRPELRDASARLEYLAVGGVNRAAEVIRSVLCVPANLGEFLGGLSRALGVELALLCAPGFLLLFDGGHISLLAPVPEARCSVLLR